MRNRSSGKYIEFFDDSQGNEYGGKGDGKWHARYFNGKKMFDVSLGRNRTGVWTQCRFSFGKGYVYYSLLNHVGEVVARKRIRMKHRFTVDTVRIQWNYHRAYWDDVCVVPKEAARRVLPKMLVRSDSLTISDKDNTPRAKDNTHFGAVAVGDKLGRYFQVKNTGKTNLILTGRPRIKIVGANAKDFRAVQPTWSFLKPDEQDKFRVLFEPSSTGLKTAIVRIFNNDTDRSPFTFTIQGRGK